MTLITPERLTQLAPKIRPDRATTYAPALEAALEIAAINTRLRLVHFMAQMAHESAGFKALVESFNYKPEVLLAVFRNRVQTLEKAQELVAESKVSGPAVIANFVYGNRPSLGNVNDGDGARFIGRGFIMITGRSNYARCAGFTGLPLLDHPEMLESPVYAAQAAAYFWKVNQLNAKADLDDITAVTKIVNGGVNGLSDRMAWLNQAKSVWPATPEVTPIPPATPQPGSPVPTPA